MPNVTLSITDEVKKKMEKHQQVKWSSVVRAIIESNISDFEEAEKIASKSKLTEKDFSDIGKKIGKNAAKHAERLLNESHS